MITKENINLLAQLTHSLNENVLRLEEAYIRKDLEGFEKTKAIIIDLKNKINDILK
jgi:hypothetical protein